MIQIGVVKWHTNEDSIKAHEDSIRILKDKEEIEEE